MNDRIIISVKLENMSVSMTFLFYGSRETGAYPVDLSTKERGSNS
jgi:hypothetical protein